MLGLIGGGYWGKNLIREFNSLNVLKTICDADNTLLEQHKVNYPHVNCTNDFNTILQDPEITMVCVSLPAHLHYKFGIQVLNAGKHLYVEKPVTLNVDEAETLNHVAKEAGLTFMVGHLLHYHNDIKAVKYIIQEGHIGNIKYITSNRKSHGIYRTFENVLWSFGVHDISIVLSLCKATSDDVVNLSCSGKSCITPNVHDVVNCTFTANDIYVNINVDWCSPIKEQRLTIVGDKGIIVFDDTKPKDKVIYVPNHVTMINDIPVANKETITWPSNNNYCINDNIHQSTIDESTFVLRSPLNEECHHFIYCCSNGKTPITNGDEAINVLKVLKRCDELLCPVMETQYFSHETSCIESDSIGSGTKIWRWTHISKDAIIGNNCNIGQGCEIAGILGNGCKVQNNVSIYKGVEAGNNVFFGPSCVLTNDINPRCEHPKGGHYIKTILEDCVTLGANCTIVCGVTIGHHALIGAGATVTKDVDPFAIMVGNPARQIGTIDEYGNRTIFSSKI